MRDRLIFALSILLLALLPLTLGTLQIRTATEILYLGLFAVSYNLLFGYGGMMSFGHNAAFGIGGYAVGILLTRIPSVPLIGAMAAAIVIGMIGGTLIGALCIRLRGGYFALLTLAFSQFLYAIAFKWRDVTHGDDGLIVPLPPLKLPFAGSVDLAAAANFYWLTLAVVATLLALAWHFMRTPLGNAIVLMRENDERARFIGYDPYLTRLAVFGFASALAAVAGILFALFQRLISPGVLTLGFGGDVVIMAMLGGTGTFFGPFLGALVYHLLQDRLAQITDQWQFFMGLLLVLLILFAPGGITGVFSALTRSRKVGRASP
jgi:branched-chain amino acid transport system permease protein